MKQFCDRVNAQNSYTAEGSAQNRVIARQRTGVRDDGSCAGFRDSCLDDYDRLPQGDFAGSREKRSGVSDRFHIDKDATCIRVVRQVED
jgi:hypothetical protein